MDNSILITIKKLLGVEPDDTSFDQDIIIGINTSIVTLAQLGVGEEGEFAVFGEEETWEDYLGEMINKLALIKSFIHIKTKMLFDPPQSSVLLSAYEKQLDELQFRISVIVDPGKEKNDANN